jgi:anti-sigma-K factor RskA
MTAPDIHALTGPYLLDAVDDDERAGFDQHLSSCTDCSVEVRELREAVTKLSVYVATTPPASLKPKVMAEIHHNRQLSPLHSHKPAASTPARRRGVVRRSLTLAAAFLAIAGSAVVALDQYRDNTASAATSTRAATILSEPDTRTIHGGVAGGGQATVVLSSRQDAAVVLVRDLKPLTGRKTYQLWFIDRAQNAHSIGLISGKSLRPTVVTGGVAGKVAFGVTVEPQGGSRRPTLPSSGGLQPVLRLDSTA